MANQLKVLGQDDAYIRAEWENLYLVVYRAAPKFEHLDGIEKDFQSLVSRYPNGIVSCVIIEPGTGAPEAKVRERSKAIMDGIAKNLRGAATVPEGEGLWGATMRSLLVGMTLLAPSSYPQEICKSQEEASGVLANWMNSGKQPADVLAVLHELRVAFAKPQAQDTGKKSWWRSKPSVR